MRTKKTNKLIRLVLVVTILTTQLAMLAPDSFAIPKLPPPRSRRVGWKQHRYQLVY